MEVILYGKWFSSAGKDLVPFVPMELAHEKQVRQNI